MTVQEYKAPASVSRLQQRAFMIGGIALLVAIAGWIKSPALFYRSYLTSYMLILCFALGSLGLLMLAPDERPLGPGDSPPGRIRHANSSSSPCAFSPAGVWRPVSLWRVAASFCRGAALVFPAELPHAP